MIDKSACKYWDCGWCYAPNYLKTNAINSACVNPYECPISPLSEPVQYETPMTEPAKFAHITRVIDPKTRIHYLDAIDNQGRHWMAQMSHNVEPWLCYTETWKLAPQKLY